MAFSLGMTLKNKKIAPDRPQDLPVTQKMLNGLREEMISKFISMDHKMDAGFQSVRSEISSMNADIDSVKSDIHLVKSDIHSVKSDIHSVKSDILSIKSDLHAVKADVHRIMVLVEEQNARNAVVLDGLTSLFARQERLETRFDQFEKG